MNFIYCFDDESKDKLLLKGFELINNSVNYNGKKAFLFINNKETKLNFDTLNAEYSNKLTF